MTNNTIILNKISEIRRLLDEVEKDIRGGEESIKIVSTSTSNTNNENDIKKTDSVNNIDKTISNLLYEIGMPSHILGFNYIRYAIKLVLDNREIIHRITKDLYPNVAKEFRTTPSRVERAIRHAIELSFDRCDPEKFHSMFGYSISYDKGKTTNSEFIALLADKIYLDNIA